jgi:hypothetical protein
MAEGSHPGPVVAASATTAPRLHVAGKARYIDDEPEWPGLLHLAFGVSTEASATIEGIDLAAVRAAPGVVAVLPPPIFPAPTMSRLLRAMIACWPMAKCCGWASRCSSWRRPVAARRQAARLGTDHLWFAPADPDHRAGPRRAEPDRTDPAHGAWRRHQALGQRRIA